MSRSLSGAVSTRVFAPPVTHVYDPITHAWSLHRQYLTLARPRPAALLLGMNPGPWGMVQTGVPFGEVGHVRDFLGIVGAVEQPAQVHPARPVEGLACGRSEVSGRRLWGWAKSRFGTARAFFETFWVWNWCPLSFMEAGGRNRTPDKLPAADRAFLEPPCDKALAEVVQAIEPAMVIGVGAFACQRARRALAEQGIPIGQILHPSPASPAANRGWVEQIEVQLTDLGLSLPDRI